MKKTNYKNQINKKKWGQIFLQDQNIINSIINSFNPKKTQLIIEIGPGLGALTKPILNIVDFLIVIERDTQLVNKLLKNFGNEKLLIFNQDVMKINFFKIQNHTQQKIRLIGNLPYNISTKLIIYLLKYIDTIQDMHFMVQKEVGERIIAKPNNKNYGRLSILTQYYYKVYPLFQISKKSFFPIPKVESVMIRFIPYNNQNKPYPIINTKLLSIITQLAFHQRRKIIRNSLSSFFNEKDMLIHNINTNFRAENLTIQQFCVLTKILYNKFNSNGI